MTVPMSTQSARSTNSANVRGIAVSASTRVCQPSRSIPRPMAQASRGLIASLSVSGASPWPWPYRLGGCRSAGVEPPSPDGGLALPGMESGLSKNDATWRTRARDTWWRSADDRYKMRVCSEKTKYLFVSLLPSPCGREGNYEVILDLPVPYETLWQRRTSQGGRGPSGTRQHVR